MLEINVNLNNSTVLVTGAAGFIGAGLVNKLFDLYEGIHIVGLDNMNDYYDVSIKEYRLKKLSEKFFIIIKTFYERSCINLFNFII